MHLIRTHILSFPYNSFGGFGIALQIPWLMHAKLQLIPTYFSIGNEILIMTTNARAILSGGVGKNGSSVAVSLMHPFLSIGGEASFSSAFFLVLEY